MDIVKLATVSVCLFFAGCSGPMDHAWNDPLYRSVHSNHQPIDEPNTRLHHNQNTQERPLNGLDGLDSLSVNDAIRVAIDQSPSLRQAGYRIDIASARVTQAGLYPNPSIVFDGEGLGSGSGVGGETIYRLEQEIVLGGKLHKATEVAQTDRFRAQADFVAEEFAIASNVTRAYYAAVVAGERLENRRQLLDLAERLLAAARAHVEAGAATEPEQLRAEVVREQAQIEFESAILAYEATKQKLASAMGLGHPVDLPLTSSAQDLPVLPDQETILASALDANSRIEKARLAINRAQKAQILAQSRSIPNIIASIGPRYSDIDNETTLDIGIEIEIPLFDRNQGNIRAALAQRLSSASVLREVQLELIAEVSKAYAAYQSAMIAADRYKNQLLPKAQRTLDLTRQAYERGKVDYLRLLDAQQVVVESRIAYIDSLQRLHEAAALLRELAQTDRPWRDSSTNETNGVHKE